jgi:tetratricopeptide (TPR) repeat protein
MEKDPARRYADCQQLADDLRRWQEGEPIRARRLSVAERLLRWCKREPKLAATLAVAVLALLAVAVISMVSAGIQADLRERAEEQTRLAESEATRADGEATEATRQKIRAKEQARRADAVAAFMRRLFLSSDPTGLSGTGLLPLGEKGKSVTAVELLMHGVRQVRDEFKDEPLTRAALMDAIGDVSRTLGLFDQARPLLEEALKIRREHLDANDPEVTESLLHLANWFTEHGDIEDAEKIYKEALVAYESQGRKESLEAAEVHLRLCALYTSISDPASEAHGQAGLDIRQKIHGPEHHDVSIAKAVLASSLLDQGKIMEALQPGLDAMKYLAQASGKDKDLGLTAVSQFQIGVVLERSKQYGFAEKAHRKALELIHSTLGREHVYNLVILYDLGHCLRMQDKVKEAEAIWRECLELLRKTVGVSHPRAIVLIASFAEMLAEQKRFDEGSKLFEEMLEAQDRRFGKNSRWRLEVLLQRGFFEVKAGNVRKAETTAREALILLRKRGTLPSRQENLSLGNLGFALTKQGGTLPFLRELYQFQFTTRTKERDLDGHIIDCENFGMYLFKRGEYAEAEPLLHEGLQLALGIKGYERFYIADFHEALGRIAWVGGRFAEAEPQYAAALPLYRELKNLHRETAIVNAQIRLLIQQCKYAEAKAVLLQFQQLKSSMASSRPWALHLATFLCMLQADSSGAEQAAARLADEFQAATEHPIRQYRSRAAALFVTLSERELPRLQTALKTNPTDIGLQLSHALCLLRLGKNEEVLAFNAKVNGLFGLNGSLIAALSHHRKELTEGTRAALNRVLQQTEQFLTSHREGKRGELRQHEASLYLELLWLASQARDELAKQMKQ